MISTVAADRPALAYERARKQYESAGLAKGELLVRTFGRGRSFDDALDASAAALYEAKLILDESKALNARRLTARSRGRTFEGRRIENEVGDPRVEVLVAGRRMGVVGDLPEAVARCVLGLTFGRVPVDLSPSQCAHDFPVFETSAWRLCENEIRTWADGQV